MTAEATSTVTDDGRLAKIEAILALRDQGFSEDEVEALLLDYLRRGQPGAEAHISGNETLARPGSSRPEVRVPGAGVAHPFGRNLS
jgi:hypothetical protein